MPWYQQKASAELAAVQADATAIQTDIIDATAKGLNELNKVAPWAVNIIKNVMKGETDASTQALIKQISLDAGIKDQTASASVVSVPAPAVQTPVVPAPSSAPKP